MKLRWLVAALLCGLAAVSATWIDIGGLEAAGTKATFDKTLVVDDGKTLRFENRSRDKRYFLWVERKPGTTQKIPVAGANGTVNISKEGLTKVTIFRAEAVVVWFGGGRPCLPGPDDCPFPPPPPPPWNVIPLPNRP